MKKECEKRIEELKKELEKWRKKVQKRFSESISVNEKELGIELSEKNIQEIKTVLRNQLGSEYQDIITWADSFFKKVALTPRSKVGAKKMVKAMRKNNIRVGVIVFGRRHTPSLLDALKELGDFNIIVVE